MPFQSFFCFQKVTPTVFLLVSKQFSLSLYISLFGFIMGPYFVTVYFLSLCVPDSCSQRVGLPGVLPGQHGAQLPPHAAAGDQSSYRPLPVSAGRLRQRHLPDEQLVHRYRPTAGAAAGGEHGHAPQVRGHAVELVGFSCSLWRHTSGIHILIQLMGGK